MNASNNDYWVPRAEVHPLDDPKQKLSAVGFQWLSALLRLGKQRPLMLEDVPVVQA